VTESGNSRTPVAIAESPSATDRNRGTAKNRPAWARYWKKNDVRPARRVGFQMRSRSTRGVRPRATTWLSHRTNTFRTTTPAAIIQITGDSRSHSGAPSFGITRPHVPERRIP
jgi:hypothetical protein